MPTTAKTLTITCFGRLPACLALAAISLAGFAGSAAAKTARCKTTDDRTYACQFRATDQDGSFEIKAPGKPTFVLNMSGPGMADGFINGTSLPGVYVRSTSDPACWINSATKTSICVY